MRDFTEWRETINCAALLQRKADISLPILPIRSGSTKVGLWGHNRGELL
jgi:hypothetical protein